MRRSIFVVLAAVTLMLVMVVPATGITNGTPDGDHHPYVGILVFDAEVPDVGVVPVQRCSGSLIAPNVVLTAGHCTEGMVAARAWFEERLQDDDGTYLVPDYPSGGIVAIEGTPHTNPEFAIGIGRGIPGFAYRDVGVVVLEDPVDVGGFAALPAAGMVDTLKNKTALDYVGYGVMEQFQVPGEGAPFWTGLRNRMFAPGALVSGKFAHSDEFIKLSQNPGGGTGGICFGDSGGPDLLAGTATVLAVNSYVTNGNCTGVGYGNRIDIPEVLDWIQSFMP